MMAARVHETADLTDTDPDAFIGPPFVDPDSGEIRCKNGKVPGPDGKCADDDDQHDDAVDDYSSGPDKINRKPEKRGLQERESLNMLDAAEALLADLEGIPLTEEGRVQQLLQRFVGGRAKPTAPTKPTPTIKQVPKPVQSSEPEEVTPNSSVHAKRPFMLDRNAANRQQSHIKKSAGYYSAIGEETDPLDSILAESDTSDAMEKLGISSESLEEQIVGVGGVSGLFVNAPSHDEPIEEKDDDGTIFLRVPEKLKPSAMYNGKPKTNLQRYASDCLAGRWGR